MKAKKRGFTLIELIVVIIIVGILAAVATPIMMTIKAKAICTEAVTTMGVIRNAVRAYSLENSTFTFSYDQLGYNPTGLARLGLTTDSLSGVYFGRESYRVNYNPLWGANANYIVCTVNHSDPKNAPKWNETRLITTPAGGYGFLILYIQTGRIKQQAIPNSGYPTNDWNAN